MEGTSFEGIRVLVVDDYATMRTRIATALQKLGAVVAEAANGVEALASLRKEPFDVLLTDIVMPEMDGFELCEEVRKTSGILNIPIIVSSTHCDTNYIVKALRLGADDYLPKPVEPDLLIKVLRRALLKTGGELSHG